jgi:hypothetical protein
VHHQQRLAGGFIEGHRCDGLAVVTLLVGPNEARSGFGYTEPYGSVYNMGDGIANRANKLDLDEARARTPSERLRNLQRFLAELSKLGLLRERTDDLEYNLRWQVLRVKWLARHS